MTRTLDERDRDYRKALVVLEKEAVAEYLTYMPYRLEMEYDEAPPAPDWTFHTGLASSGTTGIVKLANGHPDCLVLHEGLIWLYTDALGTPHFRPTPRSNPINHTRMLEQAGFSKWPASRVRAFFEGVRQMVAPDAPLFGDKATWLYHTSIEQLQIVFPQCRFLHINRDEWDHAASLMRWQGWRRNLRLKYELDLTPQELADETLKHVRGMKQYAGYQWLVLNAEAENVHHVSYEDLAADGKAVIEGVLDWLGLDAGTYDWTALDRTQYATTTGKGQQIPELVRLRKEEEGQ